MPSSPGKGNFPLSEWATCGSGWGPWLSLLHLCFHSWIFYGLKDAVVVSLLCENISFFYWVFWFSVVGVLILSVSKLYFLVRVKREVSVLYTALIIYNIWISIRITDIVYSDECQNAPGVTCLSDLQSGIFLHLLRDLDFLILICHSQKSKYLL